VAAGTFPTADQTVRMDPAVLDDVLGRTPLDRSSEPASPVAGIPLDRDL
jgi:hypothetical protein